MPGWPHLAAAVLLVSWCSSGSAFVPGGPSFTHISFGPASCPQRGPGKALLAARQIPPYVGLQPLQAVLPWTLQPAIRGAEQTRGRSAMGSVLRGAVGSSEDETPRISPLSLNTQTPSRDSSEKATQYRAGGEQPSGGLPARTGNSSPNNAGRVWAPGRGGRGTGDAGRGERGRDGPRLSERGHEGARAGDQPMHRGGQGARGGGQQRGGERGRGTGNPHGIRPRPQQIALNSRIAACRDPKEVLLPNHAGPHSCAFSQIFWGF